MRKLIYMLILLAMLGLTGCRPDMSTDDLNSDAINHGSGSGETAMQAEMGEIFLQTDCDPGNEYMTGWCCIDSVMSDSAAESGSEVKVTLPIEIKLRGNSTKEVDKKAYTIKFEDDERLLGMEPGKKWALVSNPFDKSLLRPAVGLSFAQMLGIEYTPDFRLCKVWLNEEYMGVYTAMEPVEEGESRVDITAEDGDFLLERNIGRYEEGTIYIDSSLGMRFEFNEPEEPTDEQMEKCRELLAAAEEAICSGDYEQCARLIDVESFVDFYVFHEVIKDIDFGEYSTRYYFEDGILHAGPPWDLDLTMGNVSVEKEEYKYAAYNDVDSARGLWAAIGDYYYWLCREPWFMELVQQRWQAVRKSAENLAVDNELGQNLIDRYLMIYEEELAGNFHEGSFVEGVSGGDSGISADASWSVSEPAHMSEWQAPAGTYIENVEMLRLWLIKRIDYLDSQFGPFLYDPELAVQ